MENKCVKCNVTIHSAFLGHHKCGYGNCPICKDPILNKEYWSHIRSHPGHENDAPPEKHLITWKKEIPIILVPLIPLQKNHINFIVEEVDQFYEM